VNDMSYTNSSLATYKKLSPNHSGQRTHSIDRISPHCVVGQLSVESLGGIFAKSSYQASSNYGIGTDGRIALYVEEKNRSWCTSSNENDQRAVTIECASDTKTPYWMNDKVYSSLIKLCIDICKRNGKKKLIWFNDKNKSLSYKPKSDEMIITVHRWFANKSCPGEWLYSRLGDVANKVTSALNESNTETEQTEDKKETTEKPVEQIDNIDDPEKVIWNFLISKGLNEYAVAGLMGNLKAESNLRSTNLQNSFERKLGYSDESYTKAVDSGKYKNFVHDSAGYGLAQWTYYTRKQKLIDYAKSCNKSIGDLLMQLEFLWKEIQGYTSVMSTLKNAKSIYEASTAVLTGYEKPADQGSSVKTRRAELGKQIYNNQKKSKDESPVYSKENKYSVQAGAFSSKTNAHKRAKAIKSKSINASVVFENNLYKVVIDSYATREEAQNIIAKLDSYGIKAVLR